MKTRIKVHETNGDHHGYIEWIQKLGLGYLPVEDRRKRRTNDECRRTVENLRVITHGNVMEAPRLRFSSRKQFSSAISREYEVPRRLNPLPSSFLPLFIAKYGRSLPPSSPRRARLLPPEATAFCVGLIAICTLFFTKYNPFTFFWWFFFRNVTKLYKFRNDTYFIFVRLRNLKDHVFILF